MPRYHVIIVNYNAGDWLCRSINSAIEYGAGAITVVDNASSDDSIANAQAAVSESRVQWLLNECNVGFAAANNQVLRELDADTEFAILMNPDCELAPDTIEHILNAFEAHPRLGLASGLILNEDGSVQVTCRRKFPTPWSALVRMLQLHKFFPNHPNFSNFDYGANLTRQSPFAEVEAVSGAFMVARVSAMGEVGLLDEDYFMHCEDLDWCKRFELAGWQVGSEPAAVVTHAKGVSSKSRPVRVLWSLHRGMLRFFDKFYRQQYRWPIRWLVTLGVYVSFAGRALIAWLKGWTTS
ncbi:glycosyltransferase family 2 protein [Arenicella xantha]|uniref:Glycosyltransferase 2-like domain-containing protein n=1 Tax=Arenicella xantha TaxID=644221 RepID=A0A395JI71_9GAMM|nr:glycosyltransferase family 2 protein [Arenicella xantha]RBP48444.1 hypothetical protein DFR28_10746 [Arenicella xantha]